MTTFTQHLVSNNVRVCWIASKSVPKSNVGEIRAAERANASTMPCAKVRVLHKGVIGVASNIVIACGYNDVRCFAYAWPLDNTCSKVHMVHEERAAVYVDRISVMSNRRSWGQYRHTTQLRVVCTEFKDVIWTIQINRIR